MKEIISATRLLEMAKKKLEENGAILKWEIKIEPFYLGRVRECAKSLLEESERYMQGEEIDT
jgi:hypothetical protein